MRGQPSPPRSGRIWPSDETEPRETTFVGRSTYRKRRMRDLSRLLPFGGLLVLLIPLHFPVGGGVVGHLIIVFGVWLLLVLAALFCAKELRPDPKRNGDDPGP